jgi:deoxycytidine triphosphate deaminase
MAPIIDPHDFFENMENVISSKKQVNKPFIDLTISKLFRIKSGGELDFGGSEYLPAPIEPCMPTKKEAEDSYGWWTLHEGYLLLQYNENFQLSDNQIAMIQPHPHLIMSGCSHPTLTVQKLDENFRMLLWIHKLGIRIKENARISQVVLFDL